MSSPAALIRDARTRASLTQAALARKVGVSQPMIARLERGGANPRLETLDRVIAATGHTLNLALASPPSIDESIIKADTSLSADERLRRFEGAYSFARMIGGAGL